MWNDRFLNPCGLAGRAVFDPLTLTAASMTAVGTGISAAGTIASGSAAQTAGRLKQQAANAQATQDEFNAAGELGAAQRRMLDTRLKTGLTQSTLTARAAGSGFDASVGSPLNDTGEIAQRGEYQALMDVFHGENTQSGLLQKASSERASGAAEAWAGDEAKSASYLSAAGTIASGAGSMLKTYASLKPRADG